jgi:hypothetical protein
VRKKRLRLACNFVFTLSLHLRLIKSANLARISTNAILVFCQYDLHSRPISKYCLRTYHAVIFDFAKGIIISVALCTLRIHSNSKDLPHDSNYKKDRSFPLILLPATELAELYVTKRVTVLLWHEYKCILWRLHRTCAHWKMIIQTTKSRAKTLVNSHVLYSGSTCGGQITGLKRTINECNVSIKYTLPLVRSMTNVRIQACRWSRSTTPDGPARSYFTKNKAQSSSCADHMRHKLLKRLK